MKKKTVVTVFVSVLLLSSILGTRLTMPVNAPARHHVYPGQSIQEAINSAQLGDTIFVHEGTYSQQVSMDKSLTLIGEDADTTIIGGVRVHNASYVKIRGFTIRRSIFGIDLDNCNSITISGNIVTDNFGYGIFVLNSRNIIISDNIVLDNGDRGIYIRKSSYNTVSNNTVSIHSEYGIFLYISHNNVISCNTVLDMRGNAIGICLSSSSNNNFFGNTITNNVHGIVSRTCNNNNISHNNFINNTMQAHGVFSSNVWNDDHKGNYWSNYEDRYPDAEEDPDNLGVWNTPYVIDENNVDRYPLMNPITIDYPIPILVSVVYPDSIEAGEWATITIVATNDGETAEWQTIHIGFPSNPPLENIEIVNHDLSEAESYPLGTVLPANYGEYNITSTYVMVEGVHGPWEHSEEHSMIVRVKPENIGTFTFYVKTVSRVEAVRAPPTDTKDRQSEYVYVYEIEVCARAPAITVLSPENKTYATTSVSLTFTLNKITSWIGYSLDGEGNVTITGNLTLSGLSDGSHSLIVYAKDTAGNIAASEIIYFSIEIEQPEPFPTLIVATIVIISVVGAALLVYFAKIKKTTEKVK